ncbi:MAG TPA: erythromycin esterase family protein [Gemmatimonas sp.]|nr:erythromycin esterase family protein [Gemmatimonas sp.]
MRHSSSSRTPERAATLAALTARATPLASDDDLDPLIDRLKNARVALLGEATHGTHEFYSWRARITQRLIAEYGFAFVAVEGDWPACYQVNRYVKGYDGVSGSARETLDAFDRWPTWMWANTDVEQLVEWMRRVNDSAVTTGRVGFYGLDVYSLWDSMREVVQYLERVDPPAAREARKAYSCFEPFHGDEHAYARATAMVPTSCEADAISMLHAMRARAPQYTGDGADAFFDAEQNALVAANAERYYRTMVRGGSDSWNVRDRHMTETLERLMAHHGDGAKAIVWEHNTHIGDARFTDMQGAGMVNVGQLARERWGDDAVLVGFGTGQGTVLAADEWGEPVRVLGVPPAPIDSWEGLLHEAGAGRDLLLMFDGTDDGGIPGLDTPLGHRAIGVVYDPAFERYGNWVPSIVPRRYDAFVYIEQSRALSLLSSAPAALRAPP